MVEMTVDVELTIDSLGSDRTSKQQMIWLRTVEGNTMLPIVIGTTEAVSIYAELTGEQPVRPFTHDLLRSILDHFDAQVEEVQIVDLKDSIFYADLVLSWRGKTVHLDARPSDSIALSLKYGAPIFISEAVLQEAGHADGAPGEIPTLGEREVPSPSSRAERNLALAVEGLLREAGLVDPEPPRGTDLKERIRFLKQQMERASRQERYEEAGRLRDEIASLTDGQPDLKKQKKA